MMVSRGSVRRGLVEVCKWSMSNIFHLCASMSHRCKSMTTLKVRQAASELGTTGGS
jgi:hypothetical protein